jgi:hypothetical protein
VGGDFIGIGGLPRARIAEIDRVTGNATAWNPQASGAVDAILPRGHTVYVGGEFTTIGGRVRQGVAALQASDGSATDFDPEADGVVSTIAAGPRLLYAGGTFTVIGGALRPGIAALDSATGVALPWVPNIDGNVRAMAAAGDQIVVGGDFVRFGEPYSTSFALFPTATPLPLPPDTLADLGNAVLVGPNPSTGSLRIDFALATPGRVNLAIYDAAGRFVARILDEPRPAQSQSMTWDGRGQDGPVKPGLYFVRFEAPGRTVTRRFVVLR